MNQVKVVHTVSREESESVAYNEGFLASKYGVDIGNNPYPEMSTEWKLWIRGHNAWYRYWKESNVQV